MTPRVSVVMPVFNGEAYLAAAIRSILSQTLRDLELIVIDGGSTDQTVAIATGSGDDRVRVVAHSGRCGLVDSLNEGLDAARGIFIARMDADDIAYPERLERQVAFMERNEDLVASGTFAAEFGRRRNRLYSFPVAREDVQAMALFECPLAHPTVVLRKSMLALHQLRYSTEFKVCEDWELWCRVLSHGAIGMLPECLLLYRYHERSISRQAATRIADTAHVIDKNNMRRLGLESHPQLRWHRFLAAAHKCTELGYAWDGSALGGWIEALLAAVDQARVFDARSVRRQVATRLLKIGFVLPQAWSLLWSARHLLALNGKELSAMARHVMLRTSTVRVDQRLLEM